MSTFDNKLIWSSKYSPEVKAFSILFIAFFGTAIIVSLIGFIFDSSFYEGDFTMDIHKILSGTPKDNGLKLPLLILQGTASAVGFIIFPTLFMVFCERQAIHNFFTKVKIYQKLLWLTPVIGLAFMGFNAFFIEWNANLVLPDFLSAFEKIARELEDNAMATTLFLTKFDSMGMFILGIIVIAIIPGIGEELVFRGFLQNYFHDSSKNIHLAIWVSAFLFSAMHMQFFGFVPRLFLGALFGYLYYWSANLIIPILAHVFNNAFMITMLYLNQQSITSIDIESQNSIPLSYVFISTTIAFMLIFIFRKISVEHFQRS